MAKEEGKQAKEGAAPKVKRPTARKRDLQNEKRRLQNKVFTSRAKTSIRRVEEAIAKGDSAQIQASLSQAYSSLDKGVKRGVLKKNTASRLKSRLSARSQNA